MRIIDEVLVPLTALPTAKMEFTNLDAYQFMKQADILDIGENRLRYKHVVKWKSDKYYLFFLFLMTADRIARKWH